MQERSADKFIVRLQPDPLSLDEAYRSVLQGNVGAIALFVGTTRRFTEGRGQTSRLEYDCYPEMALAEMERLCEETLSRQPLERLFAAHRTGVVPLGEASVIVAASSAHRKDAIRACEYLIDSLKASVPIWKKEVYAGGQSLWIEGGPGPRSEAD